MDRNPQSRGDVEIDSEKRFKRIFVSIEPAIQIAFGVGTHFNAVDGAFLNTAFIVTGSSICSPPVTVTTKWYL